MSEIDPLAGAGETPADLPVQGEYSGEIPPPSEAPRPGEITGEEIDSIDVQPLPDSVSAIDEVEEPRLNIARPAPDPDAIPNSNISGIDDAEREPEHTTIKSSTQDPGNSTSKGDPMPPQATPQEPVSAQKERTSNEPPVVEVPPESMTQHTDLPQGVKEERPDPLAPPVRDKPAAPDQAPRVPLLPPVLRKTGESTNKEIAKHVGRFMKEADGLQSPEIENPTPEHRAAATASVFELWQVAHALVTNPDAFPENERPPSDQTRQLAVLFHDEAASGKRKYPPKLDANSHIIEGRHFPPEVSITIQDYSGTKEAPVMRDRDGQTVEGQVIAHIHIKDDDEPLSDEEYDRKVLPEPGCWAIAIGGDAPRLYRAHNSAGAGHTTIRFNNAVDKIPPNTGWTSVSELQDRVDPANVPFPILVAQEGNGAQARALTNLLVQTWEHDIGWAKGS